MGTPQAAVVSLARTLADGHEVVAVYTQPDRPSGRGNKITYSPVKEFAISNRLTVLQPTKVKTAEAAQTFRGHNADLAVVVAYGRILPLAFLTAFDRGAVNVHFSLLPKYRGAAPVNWAIANGETVSGVTTMKMDEGLDTGDILLQESLAIGEEETSIELMSRLADLGADLLSRTLAEIDFITPLRQDHAGATIAPIMKKEDGLIDWATPAKSIANRVRAFQPFPTAFTSFRGSRLTVWNAVPTEYEGAEKCGSVIATMSGELTIRTGGNTALVIRELQPEGKKRMAARDFINGLRPEVGDILGNR